APHRPRLSLSLNGPDFQDLASTLGVHGLGAGPLDLTITSSEEADRLRIDATGSLGQLRIDSTAFVDSISQLRVATIDGQLSGPNFGRLMRLVGYPDWPESRFETTLNSELAYPRLEVRQLDLSVAGADISLQGIIPELPALSGAELSLSANGTALEPFARVFAIDDAPGGPFSVSGSVSSADDSTNIDLEYQTTLANGSVTGTIGNGPAFEGTRLNITAGRDSAATLGKALGIEGLPAAPWQFDTTVSFPDNRVYRLQQVRFETKGISAVLSGELGRETLRRDSDVQFEFEGARLADFQPLVGATPRLPNQAFTASGRVTSDPQGWLLEQLEATVGGDRFQFNGTLGSTAGLAGTRLAIEASGQNAGRFLPADQAWRLPDGPYRLNTSVEVREGRIILSDSAFNSGPVSATGSADIPWPLNGDNGAFNLAVDSRDITALISRIGSLELDPNPLEVRAKGQWRDGRIQLDLAEAKAGSSTLSLTGTLDLPPNLSATNLRMNAVSPDLSALGTISGKRRQPVSLDLKSAFTGTQTRFTMSRFDMRLGQSVVNGDLTIDFEPEVPDFNLQLASDRLDLRPFLTDTATPGVASKGTDTENLVIPDLGFPFEALARAQGKLAVRAGQLQLENITLRDTVMLGSVRNGALDITELSTAGYRGRLTAALKLEPLTTGEGRLTASLQSDGLVFNLADQPSEEKEQLPAFDIDISMTGKGAGLRQSAASMNGKVRIGSEGGRVPNVKARSASGLFLSEVLSTISPAAARQDHIQISCFATSADIRDGVVALEPGVAVQSEKLNIFMVGKINLANETLDARLRTETRNTIDLSASELFSPFVKLSGTLSKPSLKIDPKGTLLSGGAAYLSGGLSILAKKALDQLGGTSNPCDGYLEEKQVGKNP
ncbi:MAG: AsmA family protein, partial [Gammaproteobacteria bacterium]|nr:AsmA family protein [Gammaproteobacteria bacterium]